MALPATIRGIEEHRNTIVRMFKLHSVRYMKVFFMGCYCKIGLFRPPGDNYDNTQSFQSLNSAVFARYIE